MKAPLALLLGLTLGSPCSAYVLRTDSQGDEVRWSTHVEFVIDEQLAAQLGESRTDAALKAAVATIGAATADVTVSVRVGTNKGVGYRSGASDNQNDILLLEDWPYDPSALAATVVTLNTRTKEIVDADIVFNPARHFRVVDALSEAERASLEADDVQNTATHELGHAMGLMHNTTDSKVVMYPSAAPLEISKRILADDDRAGLAALYGSSATQPGASLSPSDPLAKLGLGCSASGSAGAPVALAALALLALRRRRAALVATLALAPVLALAAAPGPAESPGPDLTTASEVSVAQVRSATTVRLASAPGLLFTDLALDVRSCLKGACPVARVLRVPGGRDGDLEQVVAHEPVPAVGEQVVLATQGRRHRILRLESRVQRDQVQAALARAHLDAPGSVRPQAPPEPPAPGLQPSGTTR
jgi:uncharacterized protein (TIGR03382 family)